MLLRADGPRVAYFAEYWYTTYKCKASVGLSYPGDSLSEMQGFFKNLVSETSPYSGSKGKFRSTGTWGLPADDGSPMAELWWSSLKAFLAADEDAGHAKNSRLKTDDWDPCKRKRHSQLWLPGINHSPGRMKGYMTQFNRSYDTWSTTMYVNSCPPRLAPHTLLRNSNMQ